MTTDTASVPFAYKRKLLVSLVSGIFVIGLFAFYYFFEKITEHYPSYPEEIVLLKPFLQLKDTSKANLLYQPEAVRIDNSNSTVFVLDAGNHRIMNYDVNGNFIKQIGSVGQGPGELLRPVDFDIGHNGAIYVVEEGNQRISIFDSNGKFLNSFNINAFPPANICITNSDEIMLNQPVVDGALFDIYDNKGTKLRSFGRVEPFEHPYFDGPNRMATWAYNKVRVRQNSSGEFDVFYSARPLFRRFSKQGEIIIEKNIQGVEIDTARAYETRNRMHQDQTNPNSITTTTFFPDFDHYRQNDMLVRLIGAVNSFYVVNEFGAVTKKLKVQNMSTVQEDRPLITRFSCAREGNYIIASAQYYGTLYRIQLP